MNQTVLLQKLTPEQRVEQAFKLSDFVRELAAKGTHAAPRKKRNRKS